MGPQDFDGDAKKAIAFQRALEQRAYAAGGGGYAAPAQSMEGFLSGRAALAHGAVQPTYPRGVRPAELGGLLGEELAGALRAGLRAFGRKLPGYTAPGAVLTGLETRTSSPVRLARGDGLQSPELLGVYPCGEGAGYAGGIMSAAVGRRARGPCHCRKIPPRRAVRPPGGQQQAIRQIQGGGEAELCRSRNQKTITTS